MSVSRILIPLGMKLTPTIIYYNLWSSFVCRLSTIWNYAHNNLYNLNHLAMLMNPTWEIQKRYRCPLIVAISVKPDHLCTLNTTLWKWLLTYWLFENLMSHFALKNTKITDNLCSSNIFSRLPFKKIAKWRI